MHQGRGKKSTDAPEKKPSLEWKIESKREDGVSVVKNILPTALALALHALAASKLGVLKILRVVFLPPLIVCA